MNNIGDSWDSGPRERQHISSLIFELVGEAVVAANRAGRIMLSNPAFAQLVGLESHELHGQSLDTFLSRHGPDLQAVDLPDWQQTDLDQWRGEVWLHGKEGRLIPVLMTFQGGSDTQPLVVCFTDLTEQHQQRQQLWEMAYRDRITGLPNFRCFEERLDQALQGQRQAKGHVILFHSSGLTEIVGVHGHLVGEQVLRRLAARLKSLKGREEGVAYLDRGEFAVQLPDSTQQQAQDFAQDCLAAFRETLQAEGHPFHLKPHAGICGYPGSGVSANELIRHARLALHQAMRSSSPQACVFSLEHDVHLRERLRIEAGLTDALQRREFQLAYQPQVDLNTGLCIGSEALLRWRHPTLGQVSPATFIPIAESAGTMREIGAWVLDEACRQQRAWRDQGLATLPVAVNVSAPQLLEDDLPLAVEKTLARHGLAPDSLELEITEGLLLSDTHRASEALLRLAQMGVRLALDDFGTGYASFSYLQRFRFHRLKIDRSLIQHVVERPRDAAIISAISAMGHALDMQILAEGIEAPEQIQILGQAGCDMAQGFHFARPLPAPEAGAWMHQRATLTRH